VTIPEHRSVIVEKTVEKFGRIDILVNNAGIYNENLFENMLEDDLEDMLNINLKAVLFLTQLCMPHLIASRGNVVNVSSVCATRCYERQMAYCISKAALDQFTRCLALGSQYFHLISLLLCTLYS
jgi:NAD(P)-dependent dehydrogenase (short-subunit alcohol dehydrogenase family)